MSQPPPEPERVIKYVPNIENSNHLIWIISKPPPEPERVFKYIPNIENPDRLTWIISKPPPAMVPSDAPPPDSLNPRPYPLLANTLSMQQPSPSTANIQLQEPKTRGRKRAHDNSVILYGPSADK